MRLETKESKSIATVHYYAGSKELEIEFRQNGKVYRYFEVPFEEYVGFAAAESKGRYLNQVFKPKGHPYIIVKQRRNRVRRRRK